MSFILFEPRGLENSQSIVVHDSILKKSKIVKAKFDELDARKQSKCTRPSVLLHAINQNTRNPRFL